MFRLSRLYILDAFSLGDVRRTPASLEELLGQ
jgi:hypothetical protein